MIQFAYQHRRGRGIALGSLVLVGALLALWYALHDIDHRRRLAFRAGVLTGRTQEHARQWHARIIHGRLNNSKIC